MTRLKKTELEISDDQFPVVGIGASAGGLKAISRFLKAIPPRSGIAYVFVQHLSPDHESSLPELLQKISKIPVHQITDDIHLEPDNFYVIPENKIVTATDGVLKLSPLDDKRYKVKVVDRFFSSLAIVHQGYAIGVVLSGSLNDGTLGLEAIKAYGGITFAQDEDSADYNEMPASAIHAKTVDFVLNPEKIAAHLLRINTPFFNNHINSTSQDKGSRDEEVFKQILTLLRVRRGVDFSFYKSSTLKRRIVRRMALKGTDKPEAYLSVLREKKDEQDSLYNDMLISVTNFFRDPAIFETLCTTVLSSIIDQKKNGEPLRIWIAGCATGEEAYSMAICLTEQLGDKASAMKIQIFATDISETAINKARTGIYRPADVEGVSESRLRQFFNKIDGNYQVRKSIRDMCVFAHHNFLKDPPFSRLDLITCRNVLIYLEPVLQKKAITAFHYALANHGFLMLGKSESIGKDSDLFLPFNHAGKIFQRIGIPGRIMQVATQGSEQNFKNVDTSARKGAEEPDISKLADQVVLAKFSPSGVLVSDNFDIIQFRGKTDTWLAPSPGRASLSLLKMAREDLVFELRNLLQLAKKNQTPVGKKNVAFSHNEQQQFVDIEITPIVKPESVHYLVLFQTGFSPVRKRPSSKAGKLIESDKDLRLKQQEMELSQLRAEMRSATEEQEAAHEELQSANEELLSGSEELQSLNEELETSKEELQSTNEEINIINNELTGRNEELNNARVYTEAIINTIRDPLIILDKDLRVKRATDGFYTKFHVTKKETEGEYFYDLGDRQWDIPLLRDLLENILPEKKILTDFEVSHVFPTIGLRIMSLNSRLLDGLILLAIEDITDKRKVEQGLAEVELLFKESKERLKLAVEAAGLGTWDYNAITDQLIFDGRSKELFGLKPNHDITYQQFINMIHVDDRADVDRNLKQALAGINNGEYEKEFRTSDNLIKKLKWVKFKGKAYFNEDNEPYRFVGTSLDITPQKIHDQAIKELLQHKDDFISIASHELKTPLTSLKASMQLIDRLKDASFSDKLNSLIAMSTRSLDKVSILIEDLLNASRINQGHLELNKTQFNVAKMIDDSCHHIRAANKYAIITTGDLALEVYGDSDRLSQVVINFVNNAIKYAPESKDITISIEKQKENIRVSVSDKGPGISEEKIPHLFERYYQVGGKNATYSGLGLGLFICTEIIKKHNGKIGADSNLGQGSTFYFTLPIK